MNVKVKEIERNGIVFEGGYRLTSDHRQDCCECHYLSFEELSLSDFEGLEFNLDQDNFFTRVEGYGIRLHPVEGFPVSIAGYGHNNGYYSDELTLVLYHGSGRKLYDITKCQVVDR